MIFGRFQITFSDFEIYPDMDPDELAIANYMDLAGDGVCVDYSIPEGNPFRIISEDELFQTRQETNQRIKCEQERSKRLTLIQRTECTRPHVPVFESRATMLHSSLSGRRSRTSYSSSRSDQFEFTQNESDINIDLNRPSTAKSIRIKKKQTKSSNSSKVSSSCNTRPSSQMSKNRPISVRSDYSIPTKFASRDITTPPFSAQLTPDQSSVSTSRDEEIDNSTIKRQRKLTMHEFVDEKREIYRLQLFIDKKNKDIQNFSEYIGKNEKKIEDKKSKIESLSDQYKRAGIQIEAALARRRKYADIAARKTSEKRRELQQFKNSCEMLESDIIKKEALLETYQRYQHFLKLFVPEDNTLEKYFSSSKVLINDLQRIEDENLFLIQECNHLINSLNESSTFAQNELASADNLNSEALHRLSLIETVVPFNNQFTPIQEQTILSNEEELQQLSDMVKKTYESCLNPEIDMKPMTMLERIEMRFEKMYQMLVYVDPKFIEEKQAAKLKLRRDQQRKMKQEKQQLEQKLKTDQAIERAKKPIPQKYGRQLNERIIPIKIQVHDGEKERAKQREIEREMNLLYGEIE